MKRPIRTFDDAQRRKMIRTLWAPGSKQLTFDFVGTFHRFRPEVEKTKAALTEPPKEKERKTNAC